MKTLLTLSFFLGHVLCLAQVANKNENQNDPFFPLKKKINMGVLLTYSPVTPPPAIIADVTYGFTNKFSVGVVGGTTGALALYGIKVNAQLYNAKQFRALFRFISVYYPERDGRFMFDRKNKYVMPWMLSMAVIDTEWKTKKNIRYSLGIGALETHCIDDMKMWFNSNHDHHARHEPGGMEEETLIDLFMTLQVGVSVPASKRFTFRAESFGVFKQGELIKREEFKVTFPVNTYLAIIYSL